MKKWKRGKEKGIRKVTTDLEKRWKILTGMKGMKGMEGMGSA